MPVGALVPLITTGVSAIAGAVSNSKGARTAQTSSAQRSSSSQSGGSRRVLTDSQASLQQPLFQEAIRRITDPASVVAPLRAGVRENINQNFSGVPDLLRTKYTPSGGGASGKLGKAATGAELARLRALSNSDNDFAKLVLDVQNGGLDFGRSLYGMNEGTDTWESRSQTSEGNGTQVNPGSALGGGLTGGLQMFSMLDTLNRFLNGGGLFSGGGGGGGFTGFGGGSGSQWGSFGDWGG